MVTLYLYPEEGYAPSLRVNGEETACRGLLYTFAVKEDTLLSVGFVKKEPAAETEPLFPEAFRGQWRAADGSYLMSVGEHSLALSRWGAPLSVRVCSFFDPEFGGSEFFFAEVLGRRYELTFFGSEAVLALKGEGETIVFLPQELPEAEIPFSAIGRYVLAKDSPQTTQRELVVSRGGIFWGEERGILLEKCKLGGAEPAMIAFGGKVYAIFFCRTDELFEYTVVLRDPLSQEEFYYRNR